MTTSTKLNPRLTNAIRTIAVAFALATALSAMGAATAQAYDDHHRGRDHHEWHGGHDRGYVYEHPGAYYAPPPVYYQSAPPSPAIDFVFPLHIR